MTITVYVLIRPEEWWIRTFNLPPDACALIKAGLESFYHPFPEEGYVQLIYHMGGGIPMFFVGCI